MNPEKQRRTIAEACGWEVDEERKTHGFRTLTDGCRTYTELPDYLNDLNAMRGASDTLNDNQQWQFVQHLNEITRIKHESDSDDWFIHRTDWIWRMLNATAAQRAEAFLRTIGKWEESK